jgi:hypothetical protein
MKLYLKYFNICTAGIFLMTNSFAQKKEMIQVLKETNANRVNILVNQQPFTSFIYPDSLEKPVLYPIYASNNEIITRGFPISPRSNEPIDHPHHIGLWLNYESVNGLDFWNNSSAIPKEKKAAYGWIKTNKILETKSGEQGTLTYSANWQDINKNILLQEKTSFYFSAYNSLRIIDRITTLTAVEDVTMPDVKDGLLGLRVAHELELPSKEQRIFTDNKGNVTNVKATNDSSVSGNYITSRNITGDSAWATRAEWCMLYGKKGKDSISIVIIDHPKNIGYPTYWHARGYGLFAANPLGQKIFSNGTTILNYSLKKGESVTFRYRILINTGKERLSNGAIERLSNEFKDNYK